MRAGSLRHWLTFEKLVVDTDSDGAKVESWVDAFPINSRMPFEVVDLSGRELIAAQAVQSSVTTRLRGRYRPGFEPAMRARSPGGQVYNIQAVILDPDSRKRYVTLPCSTGLNEG